MINYYFYKITIIIVYFFEMKYNEWIIKYLRMPKTLYINLQILQQRGKTRNNKNNIKQNGN